MFSSFLRYRKNIEILKKPYIVFNQIVRTDYKHRSGLIIAKSAKDEVATYNYLSSIFSSSSTFQLVHSCLNEIIFIYKKGCQKQQKTETLPSKPRFHSDSQSMNKTYAHEVRWVKCQKTYLSCNGDPVLQI